MTEKILTHRIPIAVLKERIGGNLVPLLQLSVQTTLKEGQGLSFEEKMARVRADLVKAEPVEIPYHETSVNLLEELKTEHEIVDWIPVPKNSLLDDLQTDYVVVTNDSEAVCLQMTSTATHAQIRRKKIRELFYNGAIAVVNFKTRELEQKSNEKVKDDILTAISSETLIAVDASNDSM